MRLRDTALVIRIVRVMRAVSRKRLTSYIVLPELYSVICRGQMKWKWKVNERFGCARRGARW
jgi:hypothetical protein